MKHFLSVILLCLFFNAFSQNSIGIYQKNNAQYHYNYAKILNNEGNYTSALLSINEAMRYDITDANILYLAAAIYKGLGDETNQRKFEELALNSFETGHYFKQSPYYLYFSYGVSNMVAKKYELAYYCFNEALRYKKTAEAVYNRGTSKLYLNKIDGACADWKIARYNGITYADELISEYCEEDETDDNLYKLLSDSSAYIDFYASGIDTLKVIMYYTHDWHIMHYRTNWYRISGFIKSQQKFEGPYTDYMETNKIAEGTYQNGKLNGLYQSYYLNGKLQSKGYFVDGRPTGTWLFYYSNSQPWLIIDFEEDDFKVLQCQDMNGKFTLKDGKGTWSYSGTLLGFVCSGRYKNGIRRGTWSFSRRQNSFAYREKYNRNGEIRKSWFSNDLKKVNATSKPDFIKVLTGIVNDRTNNFSLDSEKAIDKYSFLNFK